MNLSEALKKERQKLKKTQKEMSKMLDIPFSTYFQYEQGFSVGAKHLMKIVKKLNLSLQQLGGK
jgi:transcriptional regulator with XRE-family HTH domain